MEASPGRRRGSFVHIALHPIDIAVIVAYFVFVIAVALIVSRRQKKNDADSYFVAGRSLGWLAIGGSLFATNISSEHLVGLAADGWRTGLGVGNYEWGATIPLTILATFFVPFYIGSKIRTMPEFLERRFGAGARTYLSVLTLVANVLVRMSPGLFAGSIVLNQLFGIDMWVSALALAGITVLYTAKGGLLAVAYTDLLQGVILILGTALLTFLALSRVGGWAGLEAGLDAQMFQMVKPASDSEMPWTGLVLGVPVLGIWYWCTDQTIVQRVLGGKSVHDARMGALFAGFLKILPVFLFIVPGLCARILYPDLQDANHAFPKLIADILPVGAVGLVSAALMAALMGSLSGTLNSTATLVALDFYQKKNPDAAQEKLVWVGRVATVLFMVLGLAWMVVIANAKSLFQYLQAVNAAISPPIAASFLIGVIWRRANLRGAMTALIGGLVIGLGFMGYNAWLAHNNQPEMPFLINAAITFAASIVLLVGASLTAPAPKPEQVENLTWASVTNVLAATTTPRERRTFRLVVGTLFVIMVALWTRFSNEALLVPLTGGAAIIAGLVIAFVTNRDKQAAKAASVPPPALDAEIEPSVH